MLTSSLVYMPRELICSCANVPRVPTCFVCLRAHISRCLTCWRAHVPTCLACFCAQVVQDLTCSPANVPTWSRAFEWHVSLGFLVLFSCLSPKQNKMKIAWQAGMYLETFLLRIQLCIPFSLIRQKPLTGALKNFEQ